MVEIGRGVTAEQCEAGRRSRLQLRERLHELMERNDIDAWVSPSAPGPAPAGLGSTGEPAMNLPWTHAGLPTVTLPAGAAESGLPLGVQLSARFMADERLLAWAETLQPVLATSATPATRMPGSS
jgi:Asp-tRNA(Asn)/Glu-tRNA(Gln) amidotransferase A subunit family amidase